MYQLILKVRNYYEKYKTGIPYIYANIFTILSHEALPFFLSNIRKLFYFTWHYCSIIKHLVENNMKQHISK